MSDQRIALSSHRELRVYLEPWAEQYVVPAGRKIEIIVRDMRPDAELELEEVEDGLVIYAYEGCVLELHCDGKEMEQATHLHQTP